jgi:hypothetical protein
MDRMFRTTKQEKCPLEYIRQQNGRYTLATVTFPEMLKPIAGAGSILDCPL